jgi:hypothetical protein
MKKMKILGLAAAFALACLSAPPTVHAQDDHDDHVEVAKPAPKPTRRVASPLKTKLMKELFKIIKAEPTIREVQDWATSHYQLETGRINGMATRARVKALLPDIEGSFDNMVGNNFTNTRDGLFPILPNPAQNPNPDNFKERVAGTSDQTTWQVRATWSLDRLIFNPEALDAKSLTSLQENLVREVTTMYYARRRVLASLVLSPQDDPEQYFYELQRLEEMTATLDAFTGRKFAKRSWQWDDDNWAANQAKPNAK